MIFDIAHFSLNDGPGIRTTVFLKGCPLGCSWCHNPEGKSFKKQLSYLSHKCIGCKNCSFCDVHIFKEKHSIDFEKCNACGRCVERCPVGALKIIGCNSSPEEVIKEVLKDKKYYTYGGGITVSGGEPLCQQAMLKEILELAKKNGIHTAVETSGYGDVRAIASLVDLWLYDYKGEKIVYEKYCKVDNTIIIENLEFLVNNGAKIILRCPKIPNINDDISKIKAFAKKYDLPYEILEFHTLWKDKLGRITNNDF